MSKRKSLTVPASTITPAAAPSRWSAMRHRELVGPPCPLTGRTVADDVLLAISDLACHKPHDRELDTYTHREMRVYYDAYFAALAFAERTMYAALRARALRFAEHDRREAQAAATRRAFEEEVPSHVPGRAEVLTRSARAKAPIDHRGARGHSAPGRQRRDWRARTAAGRARR
jgi:hypothetical protein